MKKLVFIGVMGVLLTGCGSQTETSKKAVTKESSTVESSLVESPVVEKLKPEFRSEGFQVDESKYKINILKDWGIDPVEEDMALNTSNKEKTVLLGIFGMKKVNFESFDVFKNLIKDSESFEDGGESGETLKIKEETKQVEPYQTSRYMGEAYSFEMEDNGVVGKMEYYFLETETDYLAVNFISSVSFFKTNEEIVKEMLNSLEPVAG